MTPRPARARTSALPPAVESMTLLVAAVIVHDPDTDRVVLIQRGEHATFGQGLWDLPGGKSDPGEPVTATAVRELYEETGLTVDPATLELAHVIHGAWGVESPDGFLWVVFGTRAWQGEPENREPGKHARVEWVPVGELPARFVPSTDAALRSYLSGGRGVTLHGWD
ncbi:NUDIX domain-containing protein [Actinacidiphila alni]|uniref:NUDIX domain-containing protein n=1 Tax=Actinacidiphila alni TaxID=380248 RepID=UPI003455BC50